MPTTIIMFIIIIIVYIIPLTKKKISIIVHPLARFEKVVILFASHDLNIELHLTTNITKQAQLSNVSQLRTAQPQQVSDMLSV